MRYSHLFFDLDRTLWDLDKNVLETLTELFDQHKLNEKGIESVDVFWNSYNVHNTALWASWEKGLIQREKIRTERFVSILNDFNINDHPLALKLAMDFLELSPVKTNLMPGAIDLLTHSMDKGHQLAIITNGFNDVQHIKIKCSGLDKYFKHIVTSETAGIQKPNPEIFHYALGLTKGELRNSLMIGDSLTADIQGAMNAGMDHVYFNPHKEQHDYNLQYEVASLDELLQII